MARNKDQELVLPVYAPLWSPIKTAEQAVAPLFEAKPPTREERELATVAREQLVRIALTGAKTKIGSAELVSLAIHTNDLFDRGAGQILAVEERPKINATHASVSQQFGHASVLALNHWLQTAMHNGADVIGGIMVEPIETKEKKRSLLALLQGL